LTVQVRPFLFPQKQNPLNMNRMKKIFTIPQQKSSFLATIFLLFFAINLVQAQGAKPKDMYEVGVSGGSFFVSGEIDPEFGFAYGLHLRKATDYLFSLRLDAVMGEANGKGRGNDDFWEFDSQWLSGSVIGVFSLNGLRFDKPRKKVNIYLMGGAGLNSYKTNYKTPGGNGPRIETVEKEIAPHVVIGGGISFRLSNKVNVGIEHQAFGLFGTRSDLLDGVNRENGVRSAFSDVPNFTSFQLNFNLGSPTKRSEPLYWGGFGQDIISSIDELKKRQDTAIADTDQDGVIDAIDQEPNTPKDVPVDTKGRTLDSDKDGVPDYKDLEPYYPVRAGERVNEDGVVVNPISRPGGVTEDRVKQMIDEALGRYGLSEPKNNVAEWFLPMIHFGADSYTVKYADYGTLASIARMLKSNPDMRLVITGYTDQTGPETYNEGLSYQRAKVIAEHLVNQHGIGRGRLVLQWKGQQEALVPQSASYMNRRVEFRVASGSDVEMDPPAGMKLPGDGGY